MSYYRVCPLCGCHLDPGERCDCGKKKSAAPVCNTGTAKVEALHAFPSPV